MKNIKEIARREFVNRCAPIHNIKACAEVGINIDTEYGACVAVLSNPESIKACHEAGVNMNTFFGYSTARDSPAINIKACYEAGVDMTTERGYYISLYSTPIKIKIEAKIKYVKNILKKILYYLCQYKKQNASFTIKKFKN